jgi:hypothetical protein
MTKQFLVSVADVRLYDISNDNLLAVGKTLVDSSIDVTLGNTDIRGGRGNQLLSTYFHTAAMELKVTETQFNLDFLALTVGKTASTNTNVFQEETIVLTTSGGGTVLGTPLALSSTTLYGWVTQLNGTVDKVTFTGSTFPTSSGASGDTVCVRYYAANNAARYLNIDSDILPKIVRVEQIIGPRAQLTGAFSLAMTSDGVSTTPLMLRALASQDLTTAACSNVPVLAKIVEVLDASNWYDNVVALSIQGGDISMPYTSTRQLVVWAIPASGSAWQVPLTGTNITFSSSVVGTATVSTNGGLVSGVAVNTSTPTIIHATISSKTSIDASISIVCV